VSFFADLHIHSRFSRATSRDCNLVELSYWARRKGSSELVAEAIARMREGRVIRQAGYDGEYGVIRVFDEGELRGSQESGLLFALPSLPERPVADQPPKRTEYSPRSHGDTEEGAECRPMVRESQTVFPELAAVDMFGQLDSDQRAAAEIVEGPLLIVAGPGTGKTRTLTHRIACLVAEKGVEPESCLAITFTNRAAGEMSERLARLIPEAASAVPVTTFHALGYRIIREQAEALDLPPGVRVADDEEREALLKEKADVSDSAARRLMRRISEAKCSDTALPEEADLYAAALRERGWLDFDDLIALPLRLLESNDELGAAYRERYRWISVDEYQDIDPLQYRLVRLLAPPGANLCAIGDPDQSIYGFRGTDVGIFERFTDDYPTAMVVHLTRNYRSTRTIVDASLQAISPTSLVNERRLVAHMADETRIVTHDAATDKAEAEFVVHTIEQLVGGSTFFSMDSGRVGSAAEGGFSFADFAVLYRTDAQAGALVEALARSGMPFQKRSHARLGEEPAVQSVIERMRSFSGDLSPVARLTHVLDHADARADLAPLQGVLQRLARQAADFPEFESRLAMGDDVDLWDPRADRISLMTLHAAKGLEFPVVFLVGCDDGVLPLYWGNPDECDVPEERRLFFVGMTRAESRLYLSHARKRRWRGNPRCLIHQPRCDRTRDRLCPVHRCTRFPEAWPGSPIAECRMPIGRDLWPA